VIYSQGQSMAHAIKLRADRLSLQSSACRQALRVVGDRAGCCVSASPSCCHVLSMLHPVRLAYQPPANSTFLLEQTSHQQPASSTLLSEQTSISHQPPANQPRAAQKFIYVQARRLVRVRPRFSWIMFSCSPTEPHRIPSTAACGEQLGVRVHHVHYGPA
jgi:hypothetical protein